MSFKLSAADQIRHDRVFNDQSEASLREPLSQYPELTILDLRQISDLRACLHAKQWVNCLVRKDARPSLKEAATENLHQAIVLSFYLQLGRRAIFASVYVHGLNWLPDAATAPVSRPMAALLVFLAGSAHDGKNLPAPGKAYEQPAVMPGGVPFEKSLFRAQSP